MKYYKISRDRLINLLTKELELEQLKASGVDNWQWYGEGYKDFMLEYINGRIPEEEIPEDIDAEFIAELNIKEYEEI